MGFMCGIAGLFYKHEIDLPVGDTLLRMLGALGRRGPDSAGLALFGRGQGGAEAAWVKLPEHADAEDAAAEVLRRAATLGAVEAHERLGGLIRLRIRRHVGIGDFCAALESISPETEVVSLGENLELVKQVGAPSNLQATFHIGGFRGSHGIGHTRLSTESKVDLSHSQPFWTRGVADMAVVHNGHITNYHRLRRIYEQQGVRFFTENDSEVIGVYLADKLAAGRTLQEALADSLDELDGSFTYLVATPDALGYARDPFSFKPLIVLETERYVALANEEIAIRAALESEGAAYEPGGHEYRLWTRQPAKVAVPA
jgi:glutamine phosphoribosylpyrophosphate amidotransferase